MVYCADHIHFTKSSLKQIAADKGGSILSIRHAHLHGKHPVFLTKRQKDELEAARAQKGGKFHLKFSHHQLRHNIKHGGDVWSSLLPILKEGWKQAKPILTSPLGRAGIDYAVEEAAKRIVKPVIKKLAKKAKLTGKVVTQIIDGTIGVLKEFTKHQVHKGIHKIPTEYTGPAAMEVDSHGPAPTDPFKDYGSYTPAKESRKRGHEGSEDATSKKQRGGKLPSQYKVGDIGPRWPGDFPSHIWTAADVKKYGSAAIRKLPTLGGKIGRRKKKGGAVAGILKPWPVRQGAS